MVPARATAGPTRRAPPHAAPDLIASPLTTARSCPVQPRHDRSSHKEPTSGSFDRPFDPSPLPLSPARSPPLPLTVVRRGCRLRPRQPPVR
ncbi:MAG: hypothetical protein ACK56F_05170, partial [bacterium]